MNSILNSDNDLYHLVEHFPSSSGIWDPKNVKITVYRNTVVACCFVLVSRLVCNTEEGGMVRVFGISLLSKIFGPKMEAVYTGLEKTA